MMKSNGGSPDEEPSPVPLHLVEPKRLLAFGFCFVLIIVGMIWHSTIDHGWKEPTWGSALAAAATLTAAFVVPNVGRRKK